MVNEFNTRLRTLLTLLFYMPTLTGGLSAIWLIVFSGDQYGIMNGILMYFNLIYEPIQWLTDTKYMMGVAIVVIVWMSFGTSFLAFIAGFRSIDKRMYEAAAIDGIRNRFQELWYITLPAMRPQLMFGAVMSISSAFAVGAVNQALTGSPSTDYSTHTLLLHLTDVASVRYEMGYASAIAVVMFIIMIALWKIINSALKKFNE